MIHVGRGNYVDVSRVVGLADVSSNDFEERIARWRQDGRLIDLCCDRPPRSVLFTDDNQRILSAIRTETLVARIERKLRVRDLAASINPFSS